MILILMGVVGSGKTTIGKMLAEQVGWGFADADDFHPSSNVEKIRKGVGLTDEDREPWLEGLRAAIMQWIASKRDVVLACSALKRSYRARLAVGEEVKFVYLKGTAALIAERLGSRHGHFADQKILASQIGDLEEPEDALTVDIAQTPLQIVNEIRRRLRLE